MLRKVRFTSLQPIYQGPRWVRIMEKPGGRKSRDTLPLKKREKNVLKRYINHIDSKMSTTTWSFFLRMQISPQN